MNSSQVRLNSPDAGSAVSAEATVEASASLEGGRV